MKGLYGGLVQELGVPGLDAQCQAVLQAAHGWILTVGGMK
jgi:hypothetical protein